MRAVIGTRGLTLAALALCIAFPALSQEPAASPAAPPPPAQGSSDGSSDKSITYSAGYSWNSPGTWGLIRNRHVTQFDMRIEREHVAGARVSIAHMLQVPVTIVARKSREVTTVCDQNAMYGPTCIRDSSRTAAVGIGILPAGIKMYVGPRGARRVFTHVAGGVMAFSGNVPVFDARRFNYVAEAGIGVEVPTATGRVVTVGYKFVHISNADSAPINPGLDAYVLHVGVRRR